MHTRKRRNNKLQQIHAAERPLHNYADNKIRFQRLKLLFLEHHPQHIFFHITEILNKRETFKIPNNPQK